MSSNNFPNESLDAGKIVSSLRPKQKALFVRYNNIPVQKRTRRQVSYLRRYGLFHLDFSDYTDAWVKETYEITIRTANNVNWLLQLSPYPLAAYQRLFDKLGLDFNLQNYYARIKQGKVKGLNVGRAVVFARVFGVNVQSLMFSDLSVAGELPNGYMVPPLPDDLVLKRKRSTKSFIGDGL